MTQIQSYSIAKEGKEKNGDCMLVQYQEDLWLMAVADGVSRQPCDWLASSQTCQYLSTFFAQSEGMLANRLAQSIQQTNTAICATIGKCEKMASTLSVVIWSRLENKLYYANIGDSRIYSIIAGACVQLTQDDKNSTGLTKVIGQSSVQIEVKEKPLQEQELVVLATDGFYEARKASFDKTMMSFIGIANFEEHFRHTISRFEPFRNDDFTVVMAK